MIGDILFGFGIGFTNPTNLSVGSRLQTRKAKGCIRERGVNQDVKILYCDATVCDTDSAMRSPRRQSPVQNRILPRFRKLRTKIFGIAPMVCW